MRDLIIVGSGPAGLTAAIYAARAGRRPLVVEGMMSGGQLTQTDEVENFPGFAEPVKGSELMERMRRQAENCGAEFLFDAAAAFDLSGPVKRLTTVMGAVLEARAVILALGARARWLGAPGEELYRSRGVSACAVCDGAFFRGKEVAVVGGGDTALGDALYLARFCPKVTLIHRRNEFRGSRALADRVLSTPQIAVEWDSRVAEFVGDGKRLAALRLENVQTGVQRDLPVAGAFVAIGHEPDTKLLAGQVELDDRGYVAVRRAATSVSGVFAAGDCADPYYKQAVVAAGAGAMAALEAVEFLR